ncbi:MAG: signal peptidase II [Acidimicrobiales bacterium]
MAILVAGADQLTKGWATRALADRTIHVFGSLRLALTTNRAGAFNLGGSLVPFLALAAVAGIVLTVTATSMRRVLLRPLVAVAVGLVLGGAAGNLADRLLRSPGPLKGSVVDFIDLGWWPVFNLADAAITIGCVLLVVSGGRRRPDRDPGP